MFKAIGLGIAILVLQSLMSEVFFAFESLLIQLFSFLSNILGFAQDTLL
jgi:hypothetical protein